MLGVVALVELGVAFRAGVGADVVDPAGDRLAECLVGDVMHVDGDRVALGAPLAPAVLDSPTSSFFLVSMLIAGRSSLIAAVTLALIWRNCGSRQSNRKTTEGSQHPDRL
jgi:hypothetical protein